MASPHPSKETQAILAPVIEWFQILEKLLRAHRIYASGHATITQFEDRLFESAIGILDTQEEFALAVKPYEFLFTEEMVYHNQDKQENISFRLHQDGLRFLTFHYGLTKDELMRFVGILQTDFDSFEYCDDDSVTLLWKSNFDHISYIVVETFIESGQNTEDMEVTLGRMTQLHLEERSPDSLAPLFQNASPATRRRIKRQDAQMITELPDFSLETQQPLDSSTDVDQQTLSAEDDVMVQRMLLILFRVMLGEKDAKEFESVSTVVQRLSESLIRLEKFDLASRIFLKLRQLSNPSHNPSPENAKLMAELYQRLNQPDTVKNVLNAAGRKAWEDLPGIESFLSTLGKPALPLIFDWFQASEKKEVRTALIPILAQADSDLTDQFSHTIRKSSPEVAIDILRLLNSMEDPHTATQIRRGFGHGSGQVRVFTLELLAKFGMAGGHSIWTTALDDSDKQVRLRSLQELVKIRELRLLKSIFAVTQKPEFEERDGDEKRFFFLGLAHLGGQRFFDFFADQLGNVLARSDKAQETSIAAVWALHALASPEAKQVVEKERDRKLSPSAVQKACETALRRWGGGN